MKFMVLMIPDAKKYAAGVMPDEKLIVAMMKYNDELAKAGVLLALDGLHPTSKGARVRFTGGGKTVTDGPFAQVREMIGGYWLWQVKSKAEAIEWAKRCPAQEGDVLEVRQVFEVADFAPEVAKKESERMDRIVKRVDANARAPRS
jgi:hypothetical protein